VFVLAIGAWFAICSTALAVRYVKFEISVDGKVALVASRGDTGQGSDIVWWYLKQLKLRPVKGYEVKPDGNQPLQATLKGKVRIHARYGGDVTVNELKLVRDSVDGRWMVDPNEVERTRKLRKK
jgi:hypothetical protein